MVQDAKVEFALKGPVQAWEANASRTPRQVEYQYTKFKIRRQSFYDIQCKQG